nr:hypothetical protein [Ktedonosporobacter rubrisoli]
MERRIAGERTTLLRLVQQNQLHALVARSGCLRIKSELEVLGLTGGGG